ncbi:MAG TPA: hypothetical protein VM912_21065 [Terriglobales bacterium]|nr:hypothetical protein [Terriglobales bacterium]
MADNIKPKNASCEGGQFNDFERYGGRATYDEVQWSNQGWVTKDSEFNHGEMPMEAGRFRSSLTDNNVSKEGDLSGFNVITNTDWSSTDKTFVDVSRADRGKEY